MIVAVICLVALVLALGYLTVLISGLLRRIKDLDAELAESRTQVAALNDVLAQAPGRVS